MKDDKKKLAVVATLAFIIVGVGAFQFLGGGGKSGPPQPAKKPAVVADVPTTPELKNPEFATAFPARNPFEVPAEEVALTKPELSKGTTAPTPLKGNISPLPVPGPNGTSLVPVVPTEQPFSYKLSGLINGRHPAAVFMDSAGAQRLVPLGSSLDGDAKLVAVRDGIAVVEYHGKHLRLSLGGSPDAN